MPILKFERNCILRLFAFRNIGYVEGIHIGWLLGISRNFNEPASNAISNNKSLGPYASVINNTPNEQYCIACRCQQRTRGDLDFSNKLRPQDPRPLPINYR